jgi:hypothetical protein
MSDYTRNMTTPGSGVGRSGTSDTTTTRINPRDRKPLILSSDGFLDPITRSGESTIKSAIKDLKSDSILTNFTENDDIGFLSEAALSGIGFTMVKAEELTTTGGSLKDFTLINTKNDETIIQNSKIVDPNVKTLSPEKVKVTEKFKSETDKFYELDDERPVKMKEESKIVEKSASDRKKVFVAKKIIPKVRRSKNTHLPRLSRARRRR